MEIRYQGYKGLSQTRLKPVFLLLVFLGLGRLASLQAQTYDQYIDSSFYYLDKDQVAEAEACLKQALRLEPANPRNPLLLNNLGTLQRRQGKLEEALLSYNSALGRQGSSRLVLQNRADLLSTMGRYEQAISDYSALLAVDEKNEDALYKRGLLFLAQGDYISAENDFERLLQLYPNSLDARKAYASLCTLRKEYDEAEKIYQFLLDRVPDDPNLLLARGELYLLKGKHGKASTDINKAIALYQKSGEVLPYALIVRAKLKLALYEKDSAKKDIEEAVSLGYDAQKAEELLRLFP